MTDPAPNPDATRIQLAINELQTLIRGHYPSAAFATAQGEDPHGVYLTVTVDVEDVDDVVDVYIARLLNMQVDECLPLYVVPVEPPERVAVGRARDARPTAFAASSSPVS
jgi:hypothetical protein